MRGGALVLAAGFSRRFGSDKRQYKLRDRNTLLITTLQLYSDTYRETVVVLRQQDEDISKQIRAVFSNQQNLTIVHSPHSELGMGHSIADGIASIRDWQYVVLALGDMPYIQAQTLENIESMISEAQAANRPCIVQPLVKNKTGESIPGHPVGFTRNFFQELSELTGDLGAKVIIKKHADCLAQLETRDPGILLDIDLDEESPEVTQG